MKHTYTFAAVAAAMLTLAGCWSQQELKTTVIEDSESFALDSTRSKDSLRVNISIEFPVSGPKAEPLEKMQESIVAAVFGENHRSTDPEQALSGFKKEISEQYRKDNLDILDYFSNTQNSDGNEDDFAPTLSWESTIEGHFLPAYGSLCSYIIYEYNYTGGAHGLDVETAIIFDMATGEAVSAEDIFADGYEDEMSKALTAHLKDSFENEDDYEMLFVKQIAPNDNFYVTDQGVTYLYGRYEIGPYAIGLTHVTVPWTEIVNLLK